MNARWLCELCGNDDNATRYHNTWTVSVAGEMPSPVDPNVGEQADDLEHEIEICDGCTRRKDLHVQLLMRALHLQVIVFGEEVRGD